MSTHKFIGIDPDVSKSGFCLWDNEQQEILCLDCLPFFQIIERIKMLLGAELIVIIEAGWLNKKSNFHGRNGQSKSVGEKIAKSVGANHQVGKLFVEFCADNGIKCVESRPANKKLNSSEFKRITGYKRSTNSEKRDAAMLVFGL